MPSLLHARHRNVFFGPEGPLEFDICHEGHAHIRDHCLTRGEEENLVTMRPEVKPHVLVISGRVIDAATKMPIKQFEAVQAAYESGTLTLVDFDQCLPTMEAAQSRVLDVTGGEDADRARSRWELSTALRLQLLKRATTLQQHGAPGGEMAECAYAACQYAMARLRQSWQIAQPWQQRRETRLVERPACRMHLDARYIVLVRYSWLGRGADYALLTVPKMAKLPLVRRLLKLFHPEGIPWPGTVVYNRLSSTAVFRRQYDLVTEHILGFCDEGTLLDVGTGPGWLLLAIHERNAALRLVGVDVSRAMVEKARANVAAAGLADRIEIREGNANHLPFAEGSFDIVVSTGSIHHWKEPTEGLNEIHRVLRPSGWALMYDLVSNTPRAVLEDMRREFGRWKMTLFWLHSFEEPFYTQKSFEQLAAATRFGQGRTEFVGLLCCLIMQKR